MKLYSRKQIVLASTVSGLIAAIVVLGLVFLTGRNGRAAGSLNASAPVDTSVAVAVPSDSSQTGNQEQSLASSPKNVPAQHPLQIPVQGTSYSAQTYTQDEAETINVYEKYNESVVNITTEVMAINWFMEPVPQSGGSGSGSVIDEKGHVLTNYHVIKDAYKLYVNMADGSRYEAKVVGSDQQNDLAVIRFDPPAGKKLRPIPFGTSKNLKVGQKVLAIGNPFGLERTLTQGIVSGLGRPIQEDDTTVLQNMIQTDASINPGNSGGPLLNSKGEIIGINTMIYSTSGGSVGIGFAIPADTATRIVPELIKTGHINRGVIDIESIQLFPDLVEYLQEAGFSAPVDKGLLVSAVKKGGNAEKAGLKGGTKAVRYGQHVFNIGGDIITMIDGLTVSSVADLNTALEDNRPGETIWVEFYRGKQKMRTRLTLAQQAKND
ncbi:MAG: trypsin-like peptidase domain-containing protein [Spirochaetaceae bacterium]|nr:trypsin-like peptidase domain-containing protein [Spirochaetaceae bacterium]